MDEIVSLTVCVSSFIHMRASCGTGLGNLPKRFLLKLGGSLQGFDHQGHKAGGRHLTVGMNKSDVGMNKSDILGRGRRRCIMLASKA